MADRRESQRTWQFWKRQAQDSSKPSQIVPGVGRGLRGTAAKPPGHPMPVHNKQVGGAKLSVSLPPAILKELPSHQKPKHHHPEPSGASPPVELLSFDKDEQGKKIRLGGGSFGVVYRGTYAGKVCAIKTFSEGLKEEAIKEFRATKNLQKHANIVHVLDLVENPESRAKHCLVMEMCEESLESLIVERSKGLNAKGGWIMIHRKIEILLGVAQGMIFLHSQDIVHGDLSSSNVLLNVRSVPDNASWTDHVQITDFGLARHIDPQKRHKDTMSHGNRDILPNDAFSVHSRKEVLSLSEKVDVFSFGCLTLEISCGEFPRPENINPPSAEMQDVQFRALLETRRRTKYLKRLSASEKDAFDECIRSCLMSKDFRGSFSEIKHTLVQHLHKYGSGEEDLSQLQCLSTQLETLKAELRSAKVQIKDQFERGEVLETKNNILEQEFQQLEEDLQEREKQLAAREEELVGLRTAAELLEKDRNEWKVKYEEHKKTSESYQSQMGGFTELWKELTAAKEKCANLDVEKKKLLETNSDLEENLKGKSKQVDELNREKAKLQKHTDSETAKMRKLQHHNEQLNAEVSRLEKLASEVPRLRSTVKRKTEDLESSLKNRDELKTKLESTTKQWQHQGEKLSEMQEKAASAEQAVKKLEWKRKDIERDRDAKGTSLSETQREVKKLKDELANESKISEQWKSKVQEHLTTISGLTEDVQTLQSRAFSYEQKYKAEATDRDTANMSLTACKSKLEETTARNDSLQQEYSKLKVQMEQLESEHSSLKEAYRKLNAEKDVLNVDLREAKTVRKRTLEDYNESQSVIRDLKLTLKSQMDECVPQLENENTKMKEELEKMTTELEETRRTQSQFEERVRLLEEEKDGAKAELMQLAEQLRSEKFKSEQLKAERDNEKQGKEKLKELADELAVSCRNAESQSARYQEDLKDYRLLQQKLNNTLKQKQDETTQLHELKEKEMQLKREVENMKVTCRETETTTQQCQHYREQLLARNSELQRKLKEMRDRYAESEDQVLKEVRKSANILRQYKKLKREKCDLEKQKNELAVKVATNFEYEKHIEKLEEKLVSCQGELQATVHELCTYKKECQTWEMGIEDNRRLQEKLKSEEYALVARSKLLDERESHVEALKEVVHLVKSGQKEALQDVLDKMFKIPPPYPAEEGAGATPQSHGSERDIYLTQAVQHITQLYKDKASLEQELITLKNGRDAAEVFKHEMKTELEQLRKELSNWKRERDHAIKELEVVCNGNQHRMVTIWRALPTVQQVTAFMLQFRYCDFDFFRDEYEYPFENIRAWCKFDTLIAKEMVEVEKLSQVKATDICSDLKWISLELNRLLTDLDRKFTMEPHGNVVIPFIGYGRKASFAVLRFCTLPWLLMKGCHRNVVIVACVQLTKQCFTDGQIAKEGANGIIYQPEMVVNGQAQVLRDLPVPCKQNKLPKQLAMIKKWLDSVMAEKLKNTATEPFRMVLQS